MSRYFILNYNLEEFVAKLELTNEFISQQDNYLNHTAKSTKKWLAEHNSPDLNQIQNLWHYFKIKINSKTH